MTENTIVFKGTKDGLYIILKDDISIETIKEQLDKKVKPSRKFFEGAKIVNIKGKSLTVSEYNEIKSILKNDYNMTVTGKYEEVQNGIYNDTDEDKDKVASINFPYDNVTEGRCLTVWATVRSGQRIEYKGNIVIIGDVNPGAYIKADGSITVMGTLRGLAHAGANGDYSTFIAALNINPYQIRIGDIIAKAPEGKTYNSINFEIAVVEKGNIVINPGKQ